MKKRYDELFGEIVSILRLDHAGAALIGDRLDPRYYNQSIGQAWHDRRLDDLLFLRYVSQMLAAAGDRHTRLSLLPSESYTPWRSGFYTRRYGDSLYVTAAAEETRLRPGDRICAINGGTPGEHRRTIQKNIFFADEPEREEWTGLLKMAESVDLLRPDGSTERLELRRYPADGAGAPVMRLYERPGGLILDLRNVPDVDDDALLSLLPRLCRRETPLAALLDTEYYVNYTRFNCMVKAAGLQALPGSEPYIEELRVKAGRGPVLESADDGTLVPGEADGRVAVLTDTWTRDGAEALALAARRAGARLIGRATLGTLDLAGDVSYALDERFVLTWPTAVTRAAHEKAGCMGRGLAPDEYIPWTPAACASDPIMDAAIRYVDT